MSTHKKMYWGASTASHQVEGGTHNQWSVWELENANELAKTAKHRLGWLANWQDIKAQASDPSNYISDKGVDHYTRYQEDFDLLQSLNLNAFRFGIEWARIEPEQGVWDKAALAHYKQYIASLNQRGIEPFINLWHWTMPVWFTEMGGFEKRSNIAYFEAFVKKVSEELLRDVRYVITINEPNVYMGLSYSDGEWPPQKKSKLLAMYVYYNLAVAHKKAYKIIKQKHPHMQIGVAQQLANIQAFRPGHWFDETVVKLMRYFWNWWWLNRTNKQQDFIGFNYYFTDYYKGFRKQNPTKPINDLGWYMEPKGVLPLLQRIAYHYPKKPIFITENGVADAHDTYRQWWLQETMVAIETAKSQGIPVAGYLHWSLLDNFEWKYGWWPKFGLVAVDRKTMKRTVRSSSKWWAHYIDKT
ncbi:MAG: family 1 glycosylhydrolase [Candidatus Saccharimonadales bacterium]